MLRAQPLGGFDQPEVTPANGQALKGEAEGAGVPQDGLAFGHEAIACWNRRALR
jgi:hypothetical protein